MGFFPDGMPLPEPNMDDAGFWEGCRTRSLRFQACGDCGVPRHPPTPACSRCGSFATAWRDAPDRARIFTYTVVHHAVHPAVKARLPYVVAVVEFPELPGVRLVTNVTDVETDEVRIGQEVDLWWDAAGDGYLPLFRPAAAEMPG